MFSNPKNLTGPLHDTVQFEGDLDVVEDLAYVICGVETVLLLTQDPGDATGGLVGDNDHDADVGGAHFVQLGRSVCDSGRR